MKVPYGRMILASVALLFAVTVASSKAPLSKLLISGGTLPQPIEVTDPKLLQVSNPWFGTFIAAWDDTSGQRIADVPGTAPRYEISFYATLSAKEPPHIIYVAYYTFDSRTHRGFVYLPGPREQWYDTNAGSIVRPNQDGRWNTANPAWCDQINLIIARAMGSMAGKAVV